MKMHFTHAPSFLRPRLFSRLLAVTVFCLLSALFTLPTSSVLAASPPPSFVLDALKRAGFVQIKPHMVHTVAQSSTPQVINTATPGPFQFNDVIFSLGNSLFVAAELGDTGSNYAMLRARTSGSSIGLWEQFNWYAAPNGSSYLIQSNANGLFVAAELGATGSNYAMLRARTSGSSVGPWEQFNLFTLNGCDPHAANCQAIIQSNANGLFVAAELGTTGGSYAMLRARTSGSSIGPWEQFDV